MKLALRLAVSTVVVAMTTALAPYAALAVCSSGGMVANVNHCVPAQNKDTDCFLEWSISPVPPLDPKLANSPTATINCIDNDPTCDNDKTPGQCTFMVGACVNVVDPRFACPVSDSGTYLLKKPSTKDAARPDKNPFARDNRRNLDLGLDGLVPTAATDVCADERPFVVPLKKGKKQTLQIQAQMFNIALSDSDKDTVKLTCLPNPNIATQPLASARHITLPSELIGGPMAMGRVGDWIIENDRVRFIVRDKGRDFSFMLTYGGHIIDGDFQRSSGPGRDNFLAMTPLINISSTDNPTSIAVLNSGAAGGPAVLQTTGPDDLFDPIDPAVAIKGFALNLSVPPSAIDTNIPVTVMNEYTLAPGDDFVEIETLVNNTSGSTLNIYVGDFTSGGGQLEVVAPGLGFGEASIRIGGDQTPPLGPPEKTFDFLGWFGFGESQGVSYGLIPQTYDNTSAFTQSGVVVPIYGQNLVGILLAPDNNKPPGALQITAGGTNSFKRWFAMSANGMGSILDARHKLIARGEITPPINQSVKTGWIQGTVTVGGVPVDGARVSIATIPGLRGAAYGLVDVFETKDGGFFQGTLPKGEYIALAKIPGYPYEGGGANPIEKPVKISSVGVVNFDFPATGFVQVDVTDGVSTLPLSAKVSVVGLQATPEPPITESATLATVNGSLFGYDAHEKVVIYGLPQVHFAGPSGTTGAFPIPPGSYQIVVSHGPEYSVSKTPLTVTPGSVSSPQLVTASLVRVVDTTGFISSDFHVHLINSPDSVVSKEERIVTMLAEGVDYFVASDHDFKTDLTADVAALGASSLVKTAVSNEITYFDSGHFGAYPLDLVPGSVTGGAIDWSRTPLPGMEGLGYPSDNSYDLSVNEMALLAKSPMHNAKVVQANHFNSGTLGYFKLIGLDTKVAPPQSNTNPNRLRQNPALTNLYSDQLTALEVWIESSRGQNALATGENFGDYFNMLNFFDSSRPLQRKAMVCDSDTHSTTVVQAGGPRNMVASTTDNPALIDPDQIADNLNAGRNVCTSGPFMRVTITGDSGATASHDLADPLIVPAAFGSATVDVDIQSPTWAEFDQVQIFVNNVPTCTKRCIGGPNDGAACTVASQCPSDTAPATCGINFVGGTKESCVPTTTGAPTYFTPALSISTVPVNGNFRLHGTASQPLTITQDSWVVVVVRGRDGLSRPLFPMNPQSILPKACSNDPCKPCATNGNCGFFTCTISNQTTAELGDCNLNQCGVTTLAIANPLFIDFDGGGYKGVTTIP